MHEHVVIFAQLQMLGREDGFFIFVENCFDKVVEGTAVGAGAEAEDGFVGPFRAHIRPVGGRAEQQGQLFHRNIGGEVVLGADDDGQCICADAELKGFTADGTARFDFAVLNRPTGVGDVALTSHTEPLETSARADAVNGDVARVPFVAEPHSHRFAEREHSRATRADDVTRHFQRVHFGEHRARHFFFGFRRRGRGFFRWCFFGNGRGFRLLGGGGRGLWLFNRLRRTRASRYQKAHQSQGQNRNS